MKRNSTNLLSLIVLLCLGAACRSNRVSHPDPVFEYEATALRYVSAMGSGKGVLFRIRFVSPPDLGPETCQLDSLVLHQRAFPVVWAKDSSGYWCELNHYIPSVRPPVPDGAETQAPPADPIIFEEDYYPADLYLHYHSQPYRISINEFKPLPMTP